MASFSRWPPPATPERPEGRARRASSLAGRVLVATGAGCLLLYGLLAVAIASAWGPGNSDELVTGGPALIPWYGLSTLGALAALAGLALVRRPGSARWALLLAALSLAGWTGLVFVVAD
jgi:hypothetical protein